MATSAAPAAVVGATTSATRSRPHRHLPPHLPRAFATPTLRRPRALRRRVCATTLGRASVASTRVFSAGPTRAGGPRVRLGTSAAPPTVVNAATSARGCECVSLGRGPRCWDTQAPVSGSDPWRCAYCQDGPGGMYPRFFPRREFAGGRGTGALCTPLCPCWSCRLHAEFAFAVVFFHIIVTSCRGAAQTQYPTGKVQPPATHTRTLCVLWRRAAARELCGLCWYRLLLALASIQLHACATGLRDVCARDRVCSIGCGCGTSRPFKHKRTRILRLMFAPSADIVSLSLRPLPPTPHPSLSSGMPEVCLRSRIFARERGCLGLPIFLPHTPLSRHAPPRPALPTGPDWVAVGMQMCWTRRGRRGVGGRGALLR
eukprot:TRINITY_DN233_c0_g1_i4.p1 TRINITY_DN233_c0_g1~~TRINITY_DN233_c0_g1_i4.p1  ORF type:complete len:372 (+),score=-46.53 TRINITY_DN233_c0_g1_i4:239-1354(+)